MDTPLLESRSIVSRFVYASIQPIVKIAMRFGMSARDFGDIVRWVYVKVFYSTPEFWQHGHPTTLQGAIKTGIPRQLVKNLHDVPEPHQVLFTRRQNLAYRVVEGWANDPEFHIDGRPAPLPFRHRPGPTFNKLVMRYGNDVTLGAVLGDLREVGCVTLNDGIVTLVSQTYGMEFLDEDKLAIASFMIRRLGETTDHNITHPDLDERRLQRFWYQTRVPREMVDEARRQIHEKAVQAGREIHLLLAEFAHTKRKADVEYCDVGLSMFFYKDESPAEEEDVKDYLTKRSSMK